MSPFEKLKRAIANAGSFNKVRKATKAKGRVTRSHWHREKEEMYKSKPYHEMREKMIERAGGVSELTGLAPTPDDPLELHHGKYPKMETKPYFDEDEKCIIIPNPREAWGTEKHFQVIVCLRSEHERIHSEFSEIWNKKKALMMAFQQVEVD